MAAVLPGSAGLLRFTDATEFTDAPRGPWWPDDVDGFRDAVLDEADGFCGERVLAAYTANTGPDIRIEAVAVELIDAPWEPEPWTRAWALIIRNDGELTVIEYTTEAGTTVALLDHVRTREATGDRYDYVVDPRHPRTALPPGTTGDGKGAADDGTDAG